jgi:hypothetical protein
MRMRRIAGRSRLSAALRGPFGRCWCELDGGFRQNSSFCSRTTLRPFHHGCPGKCESEGWGLPCRACRR